MVKVKMEAEKSPDLINIKLYDKDFYLWLKNTASLLRNRQLNKLDYDNLIAEIESMGKREKRSLESNLIILLMHLLKYEYQPQKRTNSWKYTIIEHRRRIERILEDSPSLKPYLLQKLDYCYQYARQEAQSETGLALDSFPRESPFSYENILDINFPVMKP